MAYQRPRPKERIGLVLFKGLSFRSFAPRLRRMPRRAAREEHRAATKLACDMCPPTGQRCTATRECRMLASYHQAQLKMRIRQCCTAASEGQCEVINIDLNDLIVRLVCAAQLDECCAFVPSVSTSSARAHPHLIHSGGGGVGLGRSGRS